MGRSRRQKKKLHCNTMRHGTKAKGRNVKEDRISALPDEILIHILSSLTVREAQMTSVLSTSWRYLWTNITCLDFTDISSMVYSDFLNWVNELCSSIQSPSIQQCIIEYKSNANARHSVEKLVNIAMEKGVKDLKLTVDRYDACYSGPISSGFKHLRSLNLKCPNITGETVERFLLHCSSLEQISIEGSYVLRTLKVGGPLCNLKFLKIIRNRELTDLQICAPKLSKFQLQGCWKRINLHIGNVPLLSQVYIGGFDGCLTRAICALSSQLSQLQTLKLRSCWPCHCESGCCAWGNMDFSPLSKLSSLRVLTVTRYVRYDEDLLFLLSFLKVSPFLEKFKVEIESSYIFERTTRLLEEPNLAPCPHQCLKVLKVTGVVDNTSRFIKYITRAAPKLEKVVIHPKRLDKYRQPRRALIQYTKQFEELFGEVMINRIDRRVEFFRVD